MGLPYGENFVILAKLQPFLTDPSV